MGLFISGGTICMIPLWQWLNHPSWRYRYCSPHCQIDNSLKCFQDSGKLKSVCCTGDNYLPTPFSSITYSKLFHRRQFGWGHANLPCSLLRELLYNNKIKRKLGMPKLLLLTVIGFDLYFLERQGLIRLINIIPTATPFYKFEYLKLRATLRGITSTDWSSSWVEWIWS